METQELTNILPTATCCANLEDIIRGLVTTGNIKPGICAVFGDDDIYIKGKVLTKGYFPRLCVRWICPARGSKGLFGSGLAGYSGEEFTGEQLKNLEVTK